MKKVIHFSKLFIPCVILSVVLIVGGLIVTATRGINFGIDFKPGLIQEVRIVPPAINLTYTGSATVSAETTASGVTLVISGAGENNTTLNFYYGQYPTLKDLADALSTVDGVSASVVSSGASASNGLFANSELSSVLSTDNFYLYRFDGSVVTVEAVRDALSSIDGASVKATGSGSEIGFQIRVGDDGTDKEVSNNLKKDIFNALSRSFGEENIAIVKTDFIGSSFSKTLSSSSAILILATLALIWLYATIRFKWDFALGSVIAVVHDALIMVAFIAFTQLEFTTISIAAILTIVGYAINDTIVVLDRVRENIRVKNIKNFKELLDVSLSETLSRTIITSVTTLLAALSLFIFTTGSIKDFAMILMVGIVSGTYSTIFISSSFIALCRKNWKPSDEEKKITVVS